MAETKMIIGEWEFDQDAHTLSRDGQVVTLENRQGQVLQFFAANPSRTISKSELLELWHPRVVNEDALYVCIANLRKALGDEARAPRYIKTVPGVGYRFLAEVKSRELSGDTLRPVAAQRWPLWRLAAAVCVAVVLAIATGMWHHRAPAGMGDVPPTAVADDYQRARFLLNQGAEHYPAGMALLREVMVQAPAFAEAFALAAYHRGLAQFGEAQKSQALNETTTWLDHALTLQPDLPLAHLAKANLLFSHTWDFPQARGHYQRSLRTADGVNSASAHFHYAQFLLAMGEFQSALEHSYRYQTLDPQGYSRGSVAWIRAMAGDYTAAQQAIDQLHALEPANAYYHVCRQIIFEQTGKPAEAYAELRWLMEHTGYDAADLAEVDARFKQAGLPAVYGWLLADRKQLDLGHYAPPLSLARYAVQAGEYSLALRHLQAAIDQRQVEVLWVAVDPLYRPLYSQPAFQGMLRQIGFTPTAARLAGGPHPLL